MHFRILSKLNQLINNHLLNIVQINVFLVPNDNDNLYS